MRFPFLSLKPPLHMLHVMNDESACDASSGEAGRRRGSSGKAGRRRGSSGKAGRRRGSSDKAGRRRGSSGKAGRRRGRGEWALEDSVCFALPPQMNQNPVCNV